MFFIHKKWLSFGLVTASIILLVFFMKVTPTGMVPNEDTGTIMGAVTLPPGTSQERAMEILNRVDSLVAAEPAVDSRTVISGFGFIGGQGPSYGSIIIKLKDWEERSMMQNSDIVVGTLFMRAQKIIKDAQVLVKLAIDEGVKLVELAAPVEQKDGKLVCNQMKLGEPDASGRRSPVATGETFELPCDLVISAIGEKVDAKLMAENGIEMGRKGPAFKTNIENVWSAGDAHRGPATVVEGIADAAAFAEAVIGKAHAYEIPEQAYPTKADAIAKKGILKMASCACCEGGRCLDCNTVCENCVDSCPNRANVVVKLTDGRHEIVHIDKMCNECGNCTQFCPYASEPCHDKFTLFQTEKDMNESENKGVLFLGGDKIRVRLEKDEVLDLSQPNELPQDIETLILTLRSKYSYLYTE